MSVFKLFFYVCRVKHSEVKNHIIKTASDLFYNNGHSIYQQQFLNERLIIGGSETSPHYGGYMEGAIFRANQIVQQIKENHQ